MVKSSTSSTLEELLKLSNDRVLNSEARGTLFKKLALSGMDAKSVNKMLSDAQKAFAKARQEYTDANSQLAGLQARVDAAQSEMSAARKAMVDINHAAQTMHLTGAEGLKQEKGGDYSYIVDGDRMYADTSDFENINLVPWKEYLASKKESDDENDDEDSEISDDEYSESIDSEDIIDEINDDIGLPEDNESEELVEELDQTFEDEGSANDSSYVWDTNYSNPFAYTEAGTVEKSLITKIAKKKFR